MFKNIIIIILIIGVIFLALCWIFGADCQGTSGSGKIDYQSTIDQLTKERDEAERKVEESNNTINQLREEHRREVKEIIERLESSLGSIEESEGDYKTAFAAIERLEEIHKKIRN